LRQAGGSVDWKNCRVGSKTLLPRWMRGAGHRWPAYIFATAITLLTFFLRLGLAVAYGERPLLILFVLPIIVSSYLGGIGPGLLSTCLAALIVDFFLLPPSGTFQVAHSYDLAQLLMLILNGVIISFLIEALHRTRARAEKHAKGFEEANRTLNEEISVRRRAETELTSKNQELERFTYMISHDLKSPLVTIKTFLGYLAEDIDRQDRERALEDIHHIHGAADKMGRLLDELLEMSRIGRTGIAPKLLAYRQLVDEAITLVSGQIVKRGVEIRKTDGRIILFGDNSRLLAIWQNLLDNAVKYMGDQPTPVIEVGVDGAGAEAIFYVRDNGIGIDLANLERIFDFGVKLNRESEGSGLGLAITKKIVEMYGGSIRAESEGNGRGSCFRFTLPDAIRIGDEAS
jgi:signal transduction histidine kinase